MCLTAPHLLDSDYRISKFITITRKRVDILLAAVKLLFTIPKAWIGWIGDRGPRYPLTGSTHHEAVYALCSSRMARNCDAHSSS